MSTTLIPQHLPKRKLNLRSNQPTLKRGSFTPRERGMSIEELNELLGVPPQGPRPVWLGQQGKVGEE